MDVKNLIDSSDFDFAYWFKQCLKGDGRSSLVEIARDYGYGYDLSKIKRRIGLGQNLDIM